MEAFLHLAIVKICPVNALVPLALQDLELLFKRTLHIYDIHCKRFARLVILII